MDTGGGAISVSHEVCSIPAGERVERSIDQILAEEKMTALQCNKNKLHSSSCRIFRTTNKRNRIFAYLCH
jgi:hypothetical protein